MTPKKLVYTCITGGYDKIPIHQYVAPDWDYVLFTDNAELIKRGKYEHWTVRPLVFNKLDNVKKSRWHKVNAHILFPEYDYSLWIDANIIINNKNPFNLFKKLIKQNCILAVPNHPERTCAYEEAEIVKKLQIDYPETVDREMAFLRREKYPQQNGLTENNMILRRHNDMTSTLDLWWHMIKTYSKRDQLSFNYALWKTGVKNTPIYSDENGFGIHRKSPDFTFVFATTHNQDKTIYKSRVIPKFLGRIICCFIPNSKYRKRFRQKYIRH